MELHRIKKLLSRERTTSPATKPARRTNTNIWEYGLPESDDSSYKSEVSRLMKQIVGMPRSPIVAISITAGYGSEVRRFENRTPVYDGGLRVISYRSPAEAAIDTVLRPGNHIVEVGPYRNGNYDLVKRINTNDGELRYDGKSIATDNKVRSIRDIIRRLRLDRVQFHMNSEELEDLAKKLGVSSRERLDVYKKLGQKSTFNDTLDDYAKKHADATIGKFGVSFHKVDDILTEVRRLREYGVAACIKFDEFEEGKNLTGGKGQMLVNQTIPDAQLRQHIESFVKTHGGSAALKKVSGVVQMFVEANRVYSISTGEVRKGKYEIYEGHIQTQDGFASDGAKPIAKNVYGRELLASIWPQVVQLYRENGVVGDQNLNLLVLPPKTLALARQIYDNPRLSAIVPIDLNPRPLSGTKVAMGRFVEETGRPINFENFFTRGITVDTFYAMNPHLIYWFAKKRGLQAGKGGNFSLTNLGRFVGDVLRPNEKTSCQIYVQESANPKLDVDSLEKLFSEKPTPAMLQELQNDGITTIHYNQLPQLRDDDYASFIVENLRRIIK